MADADPVADPSGARALLSCLRWIPILDRRRNSRYRPLASSSTPSSTQGPLVGVRPRDPRCYPSSRGGQITLRVALDCVLSDLDSEAGEQHDTPVPPDSEDDRQDELIDAISSWIEIGEHVVSPHAEAYPSWVEDHHDGSPELLELSEALGRMSPQDRSAAVAEHLRLLAELTTHLRTLTVPAASNFGWDLWCPECVADPESHAVALHSAIAWKTSELCDAIALYGSHVMDPDRIVEWVSEIYRG